MPRTRSWSASLALSAARSRSTRRRPTHRSVTTPCSAWARPSPRQPRLRLTRLHLTFQVFDGTLPAGSHPSDITIFRDGVAVSACTGAGATPDPCVASVTTNGGVTTFDVRSSHASTWDVEAARVGRVAGPDRLATAVAVSQDSFPNGHAGAVVFARADDYPDALVGGPLAAAKNAPLLLTQGAQLPTATATEIARVLPAGGTVYVLGGTAAVPTSVDGAADRTRLQVVRYAGADRYTTAATVALTHWAIRLRSCSRPAPTSPMHWQPGQQPPTCMAPSC